MKAKDLTQADVGKWVNMRGKIRDVGRESVKIELENEDCWPTTVLFDTILEFIDPPAPVQEVGDVFKSGYSIKEWTILAIVGSLCLLKSEDDHLSHSYPLDLSRWTLIYKATKP